MFLILRIHYYICKIKFKFLTKKSRGENNQREVEATNETLPVIGLFLNTAATNNLKHRVDFHSRAHMHDICTSSILPLSKSSYSVIKHVLQIQEISRAR